jgi:hypothetical protein
MNFPELGRLLEQYADGVNPERAEQDFDQVAPHAPAQAVSQGVAEAFRSDQTPPFPNMLGQMFGSSSPDMRANLLNQLIAMAGPAVLAGMLGRGGGPGMGGGLGSLGGLLGGLLGGGGGFGQGHVPQVTPEQASRIPPEAVEELAREAQQQNPTIIDRMSDFAAQNPGLVKGLGAMAVGIALNHLSKQKRGGLF